MGGYRAIVVIPLMREDELVGIFSLGRPEPEPFTESQIKLTQTFADQAAIAIKNARLFNEVKARTEDLSEALQQQTATADVLKIISRSAFDLDAVLNSLTRSAVELCNSTYGVISLYRDGVLKFMAQTGCTPEFAELLWSHPAQIDRKSVTGRTGLLRTVVLVPDVTQDEEYDYHGGEIIGNYRSCMGVPLMRNGELEGVFTLMRREPGTFTPRQVELVQTFADQAVIAIENVRLFDEVQARTRDLAEALQQQTATAEVLKVISRSAFDLQAVFDTLLASAVELIGAVGGAICLRAGDQFVVKSVASPSPEYRSLLGRTIPIDRSTPPGRALLSGKIELIVDNRADPELIAPVQGLDLPTRSNLAVPLSREGRVEGAISLVHPEPNAFTQRHIDLVQTFADQAVIAIENVRLFDEVQAKTRDLTEALQQQTATADVLKVISRSAFDLQTVFDTLLGSAVALSGADSGVLGVRDGDAFRCRSFVNKSPDLVRFLSENPITPGPGSVMGRVAVSGRIEWIEDTLADSALSMRNVIRRTNDDRALVGVPLLRDARIEGAIVLGRSEPGRFSARSIELVQTFADQAVIAIENVRLFDEVQAKTRDLEEALQQQTATSNVLQVISRSAFDLQAVLTTLAESARDLCGASFVTLFMRDGDAMRLKAEIGLHSGNRKIPS